jgi:hypothetical protein
MKKVLIVFDSGNFSEGAFEFVRCLNEMQAVLVTGVFVAQADFATLSICAGRRACHIEKY